MADITPVLQQATAATAGSVYLWETLTDTDANGSSIQPVSNMAEFGTVTITGTFAAATVVLQGSNDGTNWFTVIDRYGSAISFAAAGYAEVSTAFKYLRPSTSGGGGTQDIDVILTLRGRADL